MTNKTSWGEGSPKKQSADWGADNTNTSDDPWAQPAQKAEKKSETDCSDKKQSQDQKKTEDAWGSSPKQKAQPQQVTKKAPESTSLGKEPKTTETSAWDAPKTSAKAAPSGGEGWGDEPASEEKPTAEASAWGDGGNTGWGDSAPATSNSNWGQGGSNENSSPGKGRGRGGGGGTRACFKCGEEGHMSRECPSAGDGGAGRGTRGPQTCYKCNEEGHISRDCPKAGEGGGRGRGDRGPQTCFKCNEEGHISRDCPKAGEDGAGRGRGGGGGNRACFKCGEEGHISRECPKAGEGGGGQNDDEVKTLFIRGLSYNTQEEGLREYLTEAGTITRVAIAEVDGKRRGFCHVEFSTVEEAKSAIEKFNGQELDGRTLSMDLARKRGAAGGSRACYKCNQEGHIARDCPDAGATGERPPQTCYKCNQEGHISRDCPNGDSESGAGRGRGRGGPRTCFKCGQEGHMSRECPNPGNDDGDRGRGRGRGRGRDNFSGGNDDNSNSFSRPDNGNSWGNSNTNNKDNEDAGGWGDADNTATSGADAWAAVPTTEEQKSPGGWGSEQKAPISAPQNSASNEDVWMSSAQNNAPEKQTNEWDNVKSSSPIQKNEWGGSDVQMKTTVESNEWNSVKPAEAPAANEWNQTEPTTLVQTNEWNSAPVQPQASKPLPQKPQKQQSAWDNIQKQDSPVKNEWDNIQQEAPAINNEWAANPPSQPKIQEKKNSFESKQIQAVTSSSAWDNIVPETSAPENSWGEVQKTSKVAPQNEWNAVETPKPTQNTARQFNQTQAPKSEDMWAACVTQNPEVVNEWGNSEDTVMKPSKPIQIPVKKDVSADPWSNSDPPVQEVSNEWGAQIEEPAKGDQWNQEASVPKTAPQTTDVSDPWAQVSNPEPVQGNSWNQEAQKTPQPVSGGEWGASNDALPVKADAWGADQVNPPPAGGEWGQDAVETAAGSWGKEPQGQKEEEAIEVISTSDREFDDIEGIGSDEECLPNISTPKFLHFSQEQAEDVEMRDEVIDIDAISANLSDKKSNQACELSDYSAEFSDLEEQEEESKMCSDRKMKFQELTKYDLVDMQYQCKGRTLDRLTAEIPIKSTMSQRRKEKDEDKFEFLKDDSDADKDDDTEEGKDVPNFVIEFFRRNIVLDLDRTFIDILPLEHFKRHLSTKDQTFIKQIFTASSRDRDNQNLNIITFNQVQYIVVLRKNTRAFLKSLSARFTLHIVSYINKDLLLQILRFIDPDGVFITKKDLRVKQIQGVNQAKSTKQVLAHSSTKDDFVVIDRTDTVWDYHDKPRVVILKTFAPLSGNIIQENELTLFPIEISQTKIGFSQMHSSSRVQLLSQPHIMLAEEASNDKTLENLYVQLNKAFTSSELDYAKTNKQPGSSVQELPLFEDDVSQGLQSDSTFTGKKTLGSKKTKIIDYLRSRNEKFLQDKVVSIAFLMENEDGNSLREKNNSLYLVLQEILVKRLGVEKLILDKNFMGQVDFYFVETDARETGLSSRSVCESRYLQNENANRKEKLQQVKRFVKVRRDIEKFIKLKQQEWNKKYAVQQQMEKETSEIPVRAPEESKEKKRSGPPQFMTRFATKLKTTKDIFSLFFRM